MTRTPVTSSNVKEVGWQDGTLEIQYHSGGVYHYHDVPIAKFHAILDEDKKENGSVGSHIHQHIKSQHKFTKVSTSAK